MIPDIIELNFPKIDGKQYATLTQATANTADMGEKTITTQVKIDGEIVPDFSQDWEVEFQGEKYIMPLRIPQGAKENTSLCSTIDLTFQHWAVYQLKRWPFVTIQPIAAGTYLADEEEATVQLNLKDFCILFGQVLEYYYGNAITIDLNPAWQYKQEATIITISHTKIWNVLIDAFHDKYGVRWEIKAASDNSNTEKGGERYTIRVGYPTTEVDHIFEYGFEGGLLKVERQVQSEEIRNMLKGRGGETNIPFRYFKDTDPNNKDFRPDPDWVEELANIYFPNLMGATFRSYVQGWKAAHISKYPGYTAVGESNAYAPWAYRKGYTDTKFHPVEFVADEITINPTAGDKQVEIQPGYSPYVKKGSSLDKYGPLPDTLDNNDDIYPTLQGTGLDIAVDIEQIESDDVAASTESDAQTRDLPPETSAVVVVAKTARKQMEIRSRSFTVDAGKHANLDEGPKSITLTKDQTKFVWRYNGKFSPHYETFTVPVENEEVTIEDASLVVIDTATNKTVAASGIPAGTYYFLLRLTVYNTSPNDLNVMVECASPKLEQATIDEQRWKNTFDIWVKNIWDSTKLANESDVQYSERVWKPILGDREGNTAKVVFTSGALVHEDYEFTIVDFPVPDTSKTWEEKDSDGNIIATHVSHWRIKLAKSDAELEATGLYVPSTQKQGKPGDRFVFIGTEMTHIPYVVDAEIRLDDWKKDQLGEKKEIKPTTVVTTDRVRLSNEGKPNALINQLRVGNSLRLFDKRFFNEEGKAYETLYLQSITYTYREPSGDDAALNPDVEIVLGNEYTTSANPVSMMQGEISALQKQVGSISNIEQIVRAVGDKLYLRKDGISDRSLSPTQFFSLLTSGDFRTGLVGGAGWGFYKDENGNWVLETDRLSIRQDMSVNTVVINQAEARGGEEVDTGAFIKVTRVEDNPEGYVCYFDQKGGSVANLFHIDDVAYSNRWTAEGEDLKYYKRRVLAIGLDNITLSKTDANGTGIPAEGDNIIHYGNYTDKTRQYIKVRDVIGGGYERYIEELDSVNAEGVEYYFVGKQAGESRWFVGHKDNVPYSGKGDGSYIEYLNRKFNLNNVSLSVNATVDESRKTLAGMNGEYSTELGGRTIASWWGGNMVDLFDENNNKITPIPLNAAAALVRMNGTGYFAKGNIQWNDDGSGSVAGGNLRWDAAGNVIIGSGIQIGDGSGTDKTTLASILNFLNNLTALIVPVDKNLNEISWSHPNVTECYALNAKKGFFSNSFVSAHGHNPDGGGSGGGGAAYDRLDAWADYSTDREGWVLSALLGHDLYTRLEAIEGDYVKLSELPSLTGYATEQWVLGKGYITQDALAPYLTKTDASSLYQPKGNYLTSHQTLHTLTLQLNGTEIGTFNPTANKTINIGDVASAAALASHTSNMTVHISATERALWNKAASDLSTILGSDSDTVINKWEEVVAFLDTYTEADTLAGLLGNKVDKVAGYGLSKNDFNDTLLAKLNGIEAGANRYVLPTASATVKGGAMIGSGLMMASEVLSVNLNASHIPALDWSKIATGKPTTLGGYGITDAYTRAESNGLFAPAVVYNYSNGCLVRLTTLEHRSSMLTVLIEGNSYYGEQPIKSIIQFYNYDTPTAPILASGATHYGRDFGNINAFNYDGHVYIWFKQSDGLSTFAVTAIESAGDFRIGNAVESITDAPMPADGVTRLVTITPSKGLRTDNYASVLDSRYLQPSALERYVTIDTEQTISGNKNFTGIVRITDTSATHDINTLPQLYFSIPGWCYSKFVYSKDDKLHLLDGAADLTGAHRTFVAGAFVKHDGTASQFLKADGSVDSNNYALASALSDYLPLAGGTITGNLGIGLASSVAPAYKLDVNGTAKISEGLLIGGLLSANGGISTNAVTATEIHLGPITLKYEATNKGLQVIGGGLYTDSYLSAHGPSPTTVDYEARIMALENKIAQLESRLNA